MTITVAVIPLRLQFRLDLIEARKYLRKACRPSTFFTLYQRFQHRDASDDRDILPDPDRPLSSAAELASSLIVLHEMEQHIASLQQALVQARKLLPPGKLPPLPKLIIDVWPDPEWHTSFGPPELN